MSLKICLMVYEEGVFQGGVLLPHECESEVHASNEAMLLNEWVNEAPYPVTIYVIWGPAKRFSNVKQISLKHYWPDWKDHWPL